MSVSNGHFKIFHSTFFLAPDDVNPMNKLVSKVDLETPVRNTVQSAPFERIERSAIFVTL